MDQSRGDVASANAMILIIDNYDSFVHNLARYFRQLGHETCVIRNDQPLPTKSQSPRAIVISPGPGTPNDAGCSMEVVSKYGEVLPILGVCLGHQAVAQAFGGKIGRASEPMHGRSSEVFHNGDELFRDIPSPLIAGRYHSLVAEKASLPQSLNVIAETEEGTIMAVRHCELPIFGVQFHPESILTPFGYVLLRNFLDLAGIGKMTSVE